MQDGRKIQDSLEAENQSEMTWGNMWLSSIPTETGNLAQGPFHREWGIWDTVIYPLKDATAPLTCELHDYVKGQWLHHSSWAPLPGATAPYNSYQQRSWLETQGHWPAS